MCIFTKGVSLNLSFRGERRKMEKKEKKVKQSPEETRRQLEVLMGWVRSQIEKQDIPRFVDVIEHARGNLKFTNLPKNEITKAIRLVPNYVMNSIQQRQRHRSNRNRPMIVNSLGQLHADIAFYTLSTLYKTPQKKKSGFLVAKDPFSRYIFAVILDGNRKAPAMIKAFKEILREFRSQYPGQKVQSIGFDQERSVASHLVQDFFRKKNIKYYAFVNTSSKSKMAESAIKLIRMTVERSKGKDIEWWKLLGPTVKSLNAKPISVNNKFLRMKNGDFYAPKDVTVENSSHFQKQLQKADSSYFFSQFEIDSRWVTFKFKVDDFVRPKLIVTSSEVLGTKRSEVTLEKEIFVIDKCLPYVSRRNTIEKAYVCIGLTSNRKETFQEDEIALTPAPDSASR